MIFNRKQLIDKATELLNAALLEDACFVIQEGLSTLEESGVEEYDFEDEELIEILTMEI